MLYLEPTNLRIDNGYEFIAHATRESFNGRFRDKFL